MNKVSLLLPIFLLMAGCGEVKKLMGIPDTMNSMNDKMGDMNTQLGKTSSAVHKQIIMTSYNGLMDSKNWDELSPIPFKLMPFAQAFAEEATADELINLTDLILKELTNAKLDLGTDPLTSITQPYIAGSPELKDIIQEKLAKLMVISVLAGFAPDETVKMIVSRHAKQFGSQGDGSLREAALAFLVLRAKCLKDVLLDAKVLNSPLTNVGMAEEAIKYNSKLDTISKLKFAGDIQASLLVNLSVADAVGKQTKPLTLDLSEKLDIQKPFMNWNKIRQSMDLDMKVGQSSYGDSNQEDIELTVNQQQRAVAAKSLVESYIHSWSVQK